MGRWFRFYDEVLDDPKVQRLPDRLFKSWVNILCLASKCRDPNGKLPPVVDIAFALRVNADRAEEIVKQLSDAGLIDGSGNDLAPHAWDRRQFKSDVSNERVQRHRERKRNGQRNVTRALHETPPETETEADTEQIREASSLRSVDGEHVRDGVENGTQQSLSVSIEVNLLAPALFKRFWEVFPSRGTAANPRKPAADKFARLLKSGVSADEIIAGAQRYDEVERKAGRAGTDKIAQAITWLNQERWRDYAALAAPAIEVWTFRPGSQEWTAWKAYHDGPGGNRFVESEMRKAEDMGGSWTFPSRWPAGYAASHTATEQAKE